VIGARRRAREIALQLLYQHDALPGVTPDELRETLADIEASAPVKAFALELAEGVLADLPAIDALVARAAENWEMHRIAVVDRNILRLATHEMLSQDEIPPKVSINEAIELAKRFSTGQSGAFVNGLLDRILRDLTARGATVADEPRDEEEH